MNGVSRFLSRRDKHHEKRSPKDTRHKDRCAQSYDSTLPSSRPTSLKSLQRKLPFVCRAWIDLMRPFPRDSAFPQSILPDTSQHQRSETTTSSDPFIQQSSPSQISNDLYKIFTDEDPRAAGDKDAEKKVKMLLSRLQGAGISRMGEEQANHALFWYPEDLDKAYDLLVLANESIEGELKDYNPSIAMLGAVNRNMVTCYLDALLFAMFARLDSFEAMLYDNFDDEPRKKLAAVLRLWVNLLRTGQLIKVELTKHLQDALAACGWEEAAQICQQDASEAFTFVTGALELPLLTLKMDIYHTGRENKEDDHKFVNERLLEVAIPEQSELEPGHVLTLEDCLETYFNNRIEVKRYLQRRNTAASVKSHEAKEETSFDKDFEKSDILHVETIELSGPETPIVATPSSLGPSTPLSPARPALDGRRRADSIFGQRHVRKNPETAQFDEKKHVQDILANSSGGRPRSASLLRKEILMPAWQFFSLIPWYTDNVPRTDAQVAAHFSVKRPVLGICLKRYSMTPNGAPKRLNTFVDIPLEIGLPHFISDEQMQQEGPLFGNFKLVLQSVVCHRGVSVDSGHYIALVRADCHERPATHDTDNDEQNSAWLRFDDLANQRVSNVDIKKALSEESPYLLFYQVQPIDEELANRGDPPAYADVPSGIPSYDPSRETLTSINSAPNVEAEHWEDSDKTVQLTAPSETDHPNELVGRSSTSSNRRNSVVIDEVEGSLRSASRGRTQPSTPDMEKAGFLSASRRGSRIWTQSSNKSRPNSPTGESRLSMTLSRLTGRGSKDKLPLTEGIAIEDPVIVINEVSSVENSQSLLSPPKETKETKDSLARSKSKRDKKDRRRSKSRDLTQNSEKAKGKEKRRPDRECTVM